MTIQLINIGTTPNDNTGDDPRTVGQKLNANFNDATNAASKLVGTATGQIPTSDDLDMIGATENYTSNNLNPNVFGGNSANDALAVGYAEDATLALFYLPISTVSPPSSFTQVGTFTIKKVNGFVDVANALTINSMGGLTSNKYLVLAVSGLSGMVAGESIMLMSESSSSKITVNP